VPDAARARPLRRADLDAEPLRQFEAWYAEARDAGLQLPEAAALATAAGDGRPSARMVLVKAIDVRGFVFHTGYGSRKARDLERNPQAALLFYWHPLGRQVRVEGRAVKVPHDESEAYFRTRPLPSRLAAWASEQGEPIASRDVLEARFEDLRSRFAGSEPPLPPHWGGYRLTPEAYEFWQHRENRLHDRFRYLRRDGGWVIERLQP
jgi:pyridoxamine 5'-phosphate oxidase